MLFKRKHKSNKEMKKIRDIAGRFLPMGTRVRIIGCEVQNKECLGRVGTINGFSYGALKVNVLFELEDGSFFEELVDMEKVLDVIEVVPTNK